MQIVMQKFHALTFSNKHNNLWMTHPKFQATLDRFSNKVDELILELRNGYYYMTPHSPNNAA